MRFSSCGLGEIVQWLEQWNHKTTILLRSSAVPGRPLRSPAVPCGPLRSPAVPCGPLRSPAVPCGPLRSPAVPCGPRRCLVSVNYPF